METLQPIFMLHIFGYNFPVTLNIIVQWAIIILVAIGSLLLTRNLQFIPNRKQSTVEMFVESVNKLVKDNMGEEYKAFVPFIGTIIIYLFAMNLSGLIGIKPPTSDYSINLGMALITFIVVQANAIKKIGLKNYFFGYAKPYFFMLPLNIIERIMLPVSLSLRLFGNITVAVIIVDLVYKSLSGISWFAQLGIPIPLHLYFDLFDGTIQMVIFVMLTMINIKITAEH